MNAREFRIGNLIEYFIQDSVDGRKEYWEVSEIDATDLAVIDSGLYDNYRTIPLTEELLLKFGFEKKEGRHGEYFMHKITELFRVWKTPNNSWGAGRKDEQSQGREYNTHWIVLNYQHVHQLQNLYFALTGEELNANL